MIVVYILRFKFKRYFTIKIIKKRVIEMQKRAFSYPQDIHTSIRVNIFLEEKVR